MFKKIWLVSLLMLSLALLIGCSSVSVEKTQSNTVENSSSILSSNTVSTMESSNAGEIAETNDVASGTLVGTWWSDDGLNYLTFSSLGKCEWYYYQTVEPLYKLTYSSSDSQVTIYTPVGQSIVCSYSLDGSILTITSEERGEKRFQKTSNSIDVPNHSNISGALPDSQAILGKWKTIDGELVYIFFDDGNITAGSDGDYETGTYSIQNGILRFTHPIEGTDILYYTLENGSKLTIWGDDGFTETFYKDTGEMPTIEKSIDELLEQFKTCSALSAYVSEMESLYQSVIIDLIGHGGYSYNNDVLTSYSAAAVLRCTNTYTYATVCDVFTLGFDYAPQADDFFLSSEDETTEVDWENLTGKWEFYDSNNDNPFHEDNSYLEYITLEITRIDADSIDVSWTYRKDSWYDGEFKEGSDTYTLETPSIVYNSEDYQYLVRLDSDMNIYLNYEDGVLVKDMAGYSALNRP